MARIKVLELPLQIVGEFTKTPFVIIVDQVTGEGLLNANYERLKQDTGADSVLVTDDTLNIDHD
ncbi:MAG TPA: hypothetical protein VNJ54_08000 [Plantibacter sp.]|uniref:hypothetical protein n=1 Tax=Plantibacter sp. TaxID=1871045 RepID=UPI002D06292B|nr:hypothetical protein [Plantibacter sp.]